MMLETSRTLADNASILADISELSRIPVSPGFTWTTAFTALGSFSTLGIVLFTEAMHEATAAAVVAAFNQRGYPVLNLVNENGINALNYTSRMLSDHLHSNPAQATYDGRIIAEFAKWKI